MQYGTMPFKLVSMLKLLYQQLECLSRWISFYLLYEQMECSPFIIHVNIAAWKINSTSSGYLMPLIMQYVKR